MVDNINSPSHMTLGRCRLRPLSVVMPTSDRRRAVGEKKKRINTKPECACLVAPVFCQDKETQSVSSMPHGCITLNWISVGGYTSGQVRYCMGNTQKILLFHS